MDSHNNTDSQQANEVLQSMRVKPVAKERPYKLKLRNWLNGIFMILAIATVVIYFVYPMPEGTVAIFATGCAAVIVKTAEVTIRMTRKH